MTVVLSEFYNIRLGFFIPDLAHLEAFFHLFHEESSDSFQLPDDSLSERIDNDFLLNELSLRQILLELVI